MRKNERKDFRIHKHYLWLCMVCNQKGSTVSLYDKADYVAEENN